MYQVVTSAGSKALADALLSGSVLEFTKCEIGCGEFNPAEKDAREMTALLDSVSDLDITSVRKESDGIAVVSDMDNSGFETSTVVSELGVYATVDKGGEFLFAYAYTDEPETVPSFEECSYERRFVTHVVISDDELDLIVTFDLGYVPPGGTAGQVLAKASDADFDIEWVNTASGGGSSSNVPVWDPAAGEYTNSSIKAWLDAMSDGSSYGVSIPKGSSTECTKLGANATIAVPTPGTEAMAASDPYVSIPTFFFCEVNATVDANGGYHVIGIRGDDRFSRDGSNGNVWILAPVLYELFDSTGEDAVTYYISKAQLAGMTPQPGALMPNGSMRPFILYSKYPLGEYGSAPSSVSGVRCRTFDVSHNTLITICDTANSGYAGKSYADDWYIKTMFLMKYATKDSQSVFAGCTSYSFSYSVTVGRSNVKQVVISSADAANLVVGSAVQIGTSSATNRNAGNAYARIVGITSYDSSNSSLELDLEEAITTTTSMKVMTMPWYCGACDNVEGDGSPSDCTSGKEPFVLQGIELAHGMYEILGDVILYSDGTHGEEICLNLDSRNEATDVTSDYMHTGKYLPSSSTAAQAEYPLYPDRADGLFYGAGTGASTSTGLCDYSYHVKKETVGSYEWPGLGFYGSTTGIAGLWCVNGSDSLSNAYSTYGSRLSGLGRKG